MPNVPTSSGRVVKCIANDGLELLSFADPVVFGTPGGSADHTSGPRITLQTYQGFASSTYLGLAQPGGLPV